MDAEKALFKAVRHVAASKSGALRLSASIKFGAVDAPLRLESPTKRVSPSNSRYAPEGDLPITVTVHRIRKIAASSDAEWCIADQARWMGGASAEARRTAARMRYLSCRQRWVSKGSTPSGLALFARMG